MVHEVIIAGSGGQGAMLIGQLLAYSGMLEQKHVTWIPSYGPEMRGGTANCSVIVSQEPIGSPIVSEPTTLVSMNRPSLDKFEATLCPGGTLFVNSSLVDRPVLRDDIKTYLVPASDIAAELGNARVANMVMFGAMIAATKMVDSASALGALKKVFAGREHLLPVNESALRKGMAAGSP
ncbi:MAG: 2-oxoacid:acceptor oxidoreductase family protein [Bacillota bacterium]|nr:2-oxoacid:acceptor oxidoreductase family protein [Negativicutes bacterium]